MSIQGQIHETIKLIPERCCRCGVAFAIPEHLMEGCRDTGNPFYCPNGHNLVYKSRIKDLEKRLGEREVELRAAKCETLAERQKREALEVEAQRLKRRISNGVCPCCKRTVKQLAAHMKSKHPNFKA